MSHLEDDDTSTMTTPKEGGENTRILMDKGRYMTEKIATRTFFQKLKDEKVATGHIEGYAKSMCLQREARGRKSLGVEEEMRE